MAIKGLLEHVCTYPDHGARTCHLFMVAHAFEADPMLAKILGVRRLGCMHGACGVCMGPVDGVCMEPVESAWGRWSLHGAGRGLHRAAQAAAWVVSSPVALALLRYRALPYYRPCRLRRSWARGSTLCSWTSPARSSRRRLPAGGSPRALPRATAGACGTLLAAAQRAVARAGAARGMNLPTASRGSLASRTHASWLVR
jgi:hypothetical protein